MMQHDESSGRIIIVHGCSTMIHDDDLVYAYEMRVGDSAMHTGAHVVLISCWLMFLLSKLPILGLHELGIDAGCNSNNQFVPRTPREKIHERHFARPWQS